MKSHQRVVALVGKLGHGKTRLLNKLTGKRFASNIGAGSCTRSLQYGHTSGGITVVDTPGFYASEDIAAHIAAQKLALEGTALSGVYVVVRYGRTDEIAEMVDKIMNFIGDDDLRIIVTHSDIACEEDGYDPSELKLALSSRLNVSVQNIAVVGKTTLVKEIDAFIESTLHQPKMFAITLEQVTSISSLCVATRSFNKVIDSVYAKIAAASSACRDLTTHGICYETDVVIVTTQNVTSAMVQNEKVKIFRRAEDELKDENKKNIIYGKAGLALSLRLKTFMEATNKLLSWDVTNADDPRNTYRKCNFCGAVFNKTEGCDDATICGAVPTNTTKARPKLIAEFHNVGSGWTVQYFWNGSEIVVSQILTILRQFFAFTSTVSSSGGEHSKWPGAIIESGCGASVAWSTMLPVDPELVKVLGTIEIQDSGPLEASAKNSFRDSLQYHESLNRSILETALAETAIR